MALGFSGGAVVVVVWPTSETWMKCTIGSMINAQQATYSVGVHQCFHV
jgi:hypothetical protein